MNNSENEYSGSFTVRADARCRVAIPTKFRDTLSDEYNYYALRMQDPKSVAIVTYEQLQKLSENSSLAGLSPFVTNLALDNSGRFQFNPDLAKYVGLSKSSNCAVYGCGSYFLMTSEENWQKFQDENIASFKYVDSKLKDHPLGPEQN